MSIDVPSILHRAFIGKSVNVNLVTHRAGIYPPEQSIAAIEAFIDRRILRFNFLKNKRYFHHSKSLQKEQANSVYLALKVSLQYDFQNLLSVCHGNDFAILFLSFHYFQQSGTENIENAKKKLHLISTTEKGRK